MGNEDAVSVEVVRYSTPLKSGSGGGCPALKSAITLMYEPRRAPVNGPLSAGLQSRTPRHVAYSGHGWCVAVADYEFRERIHPDLDA